MTEEKKTDYLELTKQVYNDLVKAHDTRILIQIAIAEELRRLNENLESESEKSFIQALWNIADMLKSNQLDIMGD